MEVGKSGFGKHLEGRINRTHSGIARGGEREKDTSRILLDSASEQQKVVGSGSGRTRLGGKIFWICQVCGACYIVSHVAMSSVELDI